MRSTQKYPPVVLFHGLGSCADDLQYFEDYIRESLKTYVICLQICESRTQTFSLSLLQQSQDACKQIQNNPNLQCDISLVGFSQGGLIARYVAQNCEFNGKVVNLICLGSPNGGVGFIPDIELPNIEENDNQNVQKYLINPLNTAINFLSKQINKATEIKTINKVILSAANFLEKNVGPAAYFRNPYEYDKYLKNNTFLVELNNQLKVNQSYIEKLLNLRNFVLAAFTQDEMVIPWQSAHFRFFKSDGVTIEEFEETDIYKHNTLGFKQLLSQGVLKFVEIEGGHLQNINTLENIVQYLS